MSAKDTFLSRPVPDLLLVAHGSASHPGSVVPVLELARLTAARGVFRQVKAVFMKTRPAAQPAAIEAGRPTIVMPIFIGRGYYTETLVPDALGIKDDPLIVYTPPIGADPAFPAILMKRAVTAAAQAGLSCGSATLYLVAHGSARPGGNSATADAILDAMRRMAVFEHVELGFLEQNPKAEFWRDSHPDSPIIALPLLVAAGAHTSHDMPRIFGFGDGAFGIRRERGRCVVLVSSIGIESDLVDLVIELANRHRDQ